MLTGIAFTENGAVDVEQLNALYRMVGWDRGNRRTGAKTEQMLRVSHYYIAAHTGDGLLVGFARVCGDPYSTSSRTPTIAVAASPPATCGASSST